MYKKVLNKIKTLNKNQILIGIAVLAILVTGVLISNKNFSTQALSFLKFSPAMSKEAIAKESIDYLNKSVLQNGQTATLDSVSEESGLVKIKIKIADKTYDSYATKDGKLLFPEAFTVNVSASKTQPSAKQPSQNAQASAGQASASSPAGQVTPDNVAKVAKPQLTIDIVSSCPFGLQAQRSAWDAIKTIPALAQYVTVKYIGAVASNGKTITAMHGTEEAQENLRQICIREEQPTKYWNYVGCYMKNATGKAANGMPFGDTASCQTQVGVDTVKLNACVSDPTRGLAYAKADFDFGTKFSVQGSPTYILNNQEVSEAPFGGRSADAIRSLVCSSSNNQPDFCSTKLETAPAAASFSLTYK